MKTKKISDLVNQLESESLQLSSKEVMTGGFEVVSTELQEMYAGSGTNYVLCGGNGYCPGK